MKIWLDGGLQDIETARVSVFDHGLTVGDGLNGGKCVETTPVNVEICNGRDDDCNGIIDDGLTGCATSAPDAGSMSDADALSDGGDDADAAADAADADAGDNSGAGGRISRPPDAGADAGPHGKSSNGCSCAAAPGRRPGRRCGVWRRSAAARRGGGGRSG